MARRAKMPTRVDPATIHFSVRQFGPQLWLMNRVRPPLSVASSSSDLGRVFLHMFDAR